ncbi:MAG: hypothetical protein PVF54_01955 [Anaerolineae bacterium]|jgi:hypothetical protein
MDDHKRTDRDPEVQWEERLIDDYYDHRWRRVIEPLCDKMQSWKEGRLTHAAMEETLEQVHDEVCEMRSLFRQRRDRLVNLIRHWDRDWFESWVEEQAPPRDAS